jgi:tetratricopeptide (TPR) repeat protein
MKKLFPGLFLSFLLTLSPAFSNAADSCTVWLIQAKQLMQAGEYQPAIRLIDQCLAISPANAAACNLRGCATILQAPINDEKNNTKAISYFNRAIQLDSSNCLYFNNRGWAWQNLDKYLLSLKDFEQCVQLDSNNVVFQGNVLRNYFIRNKNKEAYALCNKLITMFPEDGYAWYVRGQLKRDYLHKYPEGNKDVKKGEALGWHQGFNLMY